MRAERRRAGTSGIRLRSAAQVAWTPSGDALSGAVTPIATPDEAGLKWCSAYDHSQLLELMLPSASTSNSKMTAMPLRLASCSDAVWL